MTTTMPGTAPAPKRGSVGAAMGWMFLLEILLIWIPVVGSLIAGFIGGRKAGGVGQAAAAVFLPVVLFSILLSWGAGSLSSIPLIGALAGLGGFVFATVHVFPLLFGAIVGGLNAGSNAGPSAPVAQSSSKRAK